MGIKDFISWVVGARDEIAKDMQHWLASSGQPIPEQFQMAQATEIVSAVGSPAISEAQRIANLVADLRLTEAANKDPNTAGMEVNLAELGNFNAQLPQFAQNPQAQGRGETYT